MSICMSIENKLTIISLIIIVIGVVLARREWVISNKIRKSEFIIQIIEKFRFDEEISETKYMIDYSDSWYDEKFHNSNSGIEFKVDKYLSYLSYICYLIDRKIICDHEFKVLGYDITRACRSKDVQRYLWNLYHFSKEQKMNCAFEYLINYGIEKKLFGDEFSNIESEHYEKRLNF